MTTAKQKLDVENVDQENCGVDPLCKPRLVDSLLSCPEKDFFLPIESESTDTIENTVVADQAWLRRHREAIAQHARDEEIWRERKRST